jgi:hypothetical protein
MPKQPTSSKTKVAPMPMPQAPEEDDAMPVQRPSYALTPKPTLWQRIWYGASAERKLAVRQTPVQDSLSEVRNGVLAEMQTMARTKGGVSGSPFANVVLPQGARRSGAAPAAQPRKRGFGWLGWCLAVAGFAWLLLQVVQWRSAPSFTREAPGVIEPTALLQPPLAGRPNLADGPAAPVPTAKPVDLLAKPVETLRGKALAKLVQPTAMSTAPVANSEGQMVFAATLANGGREALRNVQLSLEIDDQAGVPLLRRVLSVESIRANGTHSERFVLDLLPNQPERLVATVPLRALVVRLVPLQAER